VGRISSTLALSLLIVGCSSEPPTGPGGPAAVIVSPPAISLRQRGAAQLSARVVDARGTELPGEPLTFTSENQDLVTVTPTGLVNSMGPAGSTIVTAASGSLHRSVTVTVSQTPSSLEIHSPVVVLPGASRQLAVIVLDATGHPILDAPVVYSSNAPEISVSSEGLVTGLGQPGTFVVTVTVGELQRPLQIVVPTHPAGIVAATQPLSFSSWGIAVSPRGVVFITEPATGSPALVRANLPSFAISPGPAGMPGGSPLSVGFSSDGAFAYVPALSPGTLSIINTSLNEIVADVPGLPVNLYGVLVAADDSTVYVTADNDSMYVIDPLARKVIASVDLKAVSNQLALHPTLPHVLASSFNAAKVIEIDEVTHQVLRTFAIGGHPQGLAVSPDGTEMYVADEDGRLVVWDLLANALKQEIPVPAGAFGLTLTPDAAQIYVAIAGWANGIVQVYDRHSLALVGTITTGGSPRRIAFDITGRTAVITDDASQVHFIN